MSIVGTATTGSRARSRYEFYDCGLCFTLWRDMTNTEVLYLILYLIDPEV